MWKALCICAAIVLGLAAIANGLFMLAWPEAWYFAVPGVTTTGPFNQHFVRDIGLVYLLAGGAFVTGVAKPQYSFLLWALPTLWLGGHALFHFWEVAAGISGHSALARDFAAVTFPAIIGLVLTLWAANQRGAGRQTEAK
jgi:hypothetical protein